MKPVININYQEQEVLSFTLECKTFEIILNKIIMKKILFNGCSFVAGDEIVWNEYCLDHGKLNYSWKDGFSGSTKKLTDEEILFYNNYRYNYRNQRNLPSMIAKNLQVEWDDISRDAHSNDMISLSTVLFLSKLSIEKRKQYHVCIGWTALPRLMKYNSIDKYFIDVNSLAENKKFSDSNINSYVESAILKSYNEDFFVNYIRNLMLLENFLLANDISYTFFKSLGSYSDCIDCYFHNIDCNINNVTLSNDKNWYKFENDKLSYMGTSWGASRIIKNLDYQVNKGNKHPSKLAALEFAKDISNFIKINE